MDREKELAYLEHTEEVIDRRIAGLERSLGKNKADIIDDKRTLWQSLPELKSWEAYAIRESIEGNLSRYADESRTLRALYRQKDSPYFGRIDFTIERDTEVCYIGIHSLTDPDSSDILVYDWRAPISSLYYNFELGPAHFSAPAGEVHGEITGKYQYKITGGCLQYMFDSHITIQDEILQRELSANASERTKSIIATIQREQNRIIRAGGDKTLIVQGAAGSGKSSIALHRVAFLLYRYRDSLKSSNILIISPGRLFSGYIAGILPELGEENILEMSLMELAKKLLGPALSLQPRFAYLDHLLGEWESVSPEAAESIRFKASAGFVRLLEEYIAERADEVFCPQDFSFREAEISREKLNFLYREQYARFAPIERMQKVREFVWERVTDCAAGKPVKKAEREQIEAALDSWQQAGELIEEYNRFLHALSLQGYPTGEEVCGPVLFEDVFPLLLFKLCFFGKPDYRFVRHLLVDEMQDYTPAQYEILNLLFDCPKTILGDLEQVIDPLSSAGSLEALQNIYQNKGICLTLKTSYRSTWEITETAKSILGGADFSAAGRHGPKPVLTLCTGEEQQLLLEDLLVLQREGYSSVAVICKTAQEAAGLYACLQPRADIRLLLSPDEGYLQGHVVTTCPAAKGLEFDCVLIPGCSPERYSEPFGRRLLYVAATRALHRLYFYCTGPSPCGCLQKAAEAGLLQINSTPAACE
ncbi:MAG: ATP-binding domain-containing protein [Provencibacterium sp.]|nr:ATP-binding domain-containing protein [Provencibacterium sp.]